MDGYTLFMPDPTLITRSLVKNHSLKTITIVIYLQGQQGNAGEEILLNQQKHLSVEAMSLYSH